MTPYHREGNVEIYVGDCREVLPHLSGVHAIVTDPPYGLGFMGKEWDHGVPGLEFWTLALAACVPGAHLVAFGGTRTYHRLACAIEDAGFEIRDCLSWLYGSGFPKSLDVSKAIDKAAGAEREVLSREKRADKRGGNYHGASEQRPPIEWSRTAPATDAARAWSGYGTALKPAWEPIVLARAPLAGTVAANVQEHGAGAINVDGCRIATNEKWSGGGPTVPRERGIGFASSSSSSSHTLGRWPANVLLDEDAAGMLDEQSGELASGVISRLYERANRGGFSGPMPPLASAVCHADRGGASRFFYTAKADRAERNLCGAENTHPTVKPLDLMRWLCTLVCPPGCTVVDPFAGSGSTLIVARYIAGRVIGIEKEREHADIAIARLRQGALPLEVSK